MTATAVDDQFNFFILKQFFIISVMAALRIGLGIAVGTAFSDRIGHSDNVKTLLQLGKIFKKVTVDISTTASLTDNTDFDSFHARFLSCLGGSILNYHTQTKIQPYIE
jgi:hypothetical protein